MAWRFGWDAGVSPQNPKNDVQSEIRLGFPFVDRAFSWILEVAHIERIASIAVQLRMNRCILPVFVGMLVWVHALAAEPDREWMTDEEIGEQVFGREVNLPSVAVPKIIEALNQHAPTNRSSYSELKKKLEDNARKLTIMDVGAVASLEKPELAWFYDLLATNKDPVVRIFGLVPKVVVLKDRSAATNLYHLARSGLTPKEQWLVENSLHGIGIDPYNDKPDEIFEFFEPDARPKSSTSGISGQGFRNNDLGRKEDQTVRLQRETGLASFLVNNLRSLYR
jgi:hypothetical protein